MKENFIHCTSKESADKLVNEFGCVIINFYKNGKDTVFVLSNKISDFSKFDKIDFDKKDLRFTNKMIF